MAKALKPLNALVYSLCAGLWNLAGEGSKAIMRQIGRELYERFIKGGLDRSSLEKALESACRVIADKLKVCEDMSFALRDDLIEVKISGCVLAETTNLLKEKGIPLIFCPYANVFVAMLEDVTGSGYEIRSVEKLGRETLITLERVV